MSLAGKRRLGIKQIAWIKGEDGDGQMDGRGKLSLSEGHLKQSSKYKFAIKKEVSGGGDRSR